MKIKCEKCENIIEVKCRDNVYSKYDIRYPRIGPFLREIERKEWEDAFRHWGFPRKDEKG